MFCSILLFLKISFWTEMKMNHLKGLYSGAAPLAEQTFNYFLSLDLPIQVQHSQLQIWIDDFPQNTLIHARKLVFCLDT